MVDALCLILLTSCLNVAEIAGASSEDANAHAQRLAVIVEDRPGADSEIGVGPDMDFGGQGHGLAVEDLDAGLEP